MRGEKEEMRTEKRLLREIKIALKANNLLPRLIIIYYVGGGGRKTGFEATLSQNEKSLRKQKSREIRMQKFYGETIEDKDLR